MGKNRRGSYLILVCYLNTNVHFILRGSIILHKNSASTYPIFRTKKQHAEIQIHCRSWANTKPMPSPRMSQKLELTGLPLWHRQLKTDLRNRRHRFCQFSGLVIGTRLAPFFAYYSCIICWFTNQNKKTPIFWRKNLLSSILFIFSQFFFPPKARVRTTQRKNATAEW